MIDNNNRDVNRNYYILYNLIDNYYYKEALRKAWHKKNQQGKQWSQSFFLKPVDPKDPKKWKHLDFVEPNFITYLDMGETVGEVSSKVQPYIERKNKEIQSLFAVLPKVIETLITVIS